MNIEVFVMHYGKRIKEILVDRRISQDQLAAMLKTKGQNVSLWIKSEYPPLKVVERICAALEIEPYEIFISKDEFLKKVSIPPEMSDFFLILRQLKPDVLDLIKDMAFKVEATFKKLQAT